MVGGLPEMEVELEMEMMAVQRSGGGGGGGGLRRQRLEDGGVAMTVEKNPWSGQGVAAVVAAAAAARMCACGGGGGWTPSSAFREQPLEMEGTPFFFSNDG